MIESRLIELALRRCISSSWVGEVSVSGVRDSRFGAGAVAVEGSVWEWVKGELA
jgi:hypothetical protein